MQELCTVLYNYVWPGEGVFFFFPRSKQGSEISINEGKGKRVERKRKRILGGAEKLARREKESGIRD